MATEHDARPQGAPRPDAAGYEKRDANAKWIFTIVGGLLVLGLITHFVIAWMQHEMKKIPPPTDEWTGGRRAQEQVAAEISFPRLQVSPPEDLWAYQTKEKIALQTYGWINRTAGVVRLPIERAMDLVMQRGLPVRAGTNQSRLGPTPLELQQQRTNYNEQEIRFRR